jgi:hypothetical protein
MKLTGSTILATSAVITGIAVIFAIIGLATPKWLTTGHGLWNCPRVCSLSAAALAIIGLLLLIASIILIIVHFIRSLPQKFRVLPLVLLIVATLFLLATTASYLRQMGITDYSFELMVTAHVFAFLASVLLAFWFGTTMHGNAVTGTMKPVATVSSGTVPSSRII